MALVETGLKIRYFFNEGVSDGDTTPTTANDSGPATETDLTLDFDGGTNMEWDVVTDHESLESTSTTGAHEGRYSIVSGDKLDTGLEVQTLTVEIRCAVDAGNSSNGRIGVVQDLSGSNPELGLTADGSQFEAYWQRTLVRSWLLSGSTGTNNWHVVYDTSQGTPADRVKIYKNGSLFTVFEDANPGTSALSITLSSDQIFVLNREAHSSWDRSIDGRLYYFAIYAHAFSAAECSQASDSLDTTDDATGSTATGQPMAKRWGGVKHALGGDPGRGGNYQWAKSASGLLLPKKSIFLPVGV